MISIEALNAQFDAIDACSLMLMRQDTLAIVGISPFNSYFNATRIEQILQAVMTKFQDLIIFIPDKISKYTLQALGYDQLRIHHKIRKQDNYLRNKVRKALSSQGKNDSKIVMLSQLTDNLHYQQLYDFCTNKFHHDSIFRDKCLETSNWVLSHQETRTMRLEQAASIAVEYFIRELPIFLNAPQILAVDSCVFIYHSIPAFLREIYLERQPDLVSPHQGFAILELQ